MGWFTNLFKSSKKVRQNTPSQVFLTNTLSNNKELFISRKPGIVLMYSCGPTVYGPAHIGNLRSYVFSDTLARALAQAGYRVKRVINITDVGHLVGDADEGEDKMQVSARQEKKSPEDIADRYSKQFLEDLESLNIDVEDILFPRATEYISEQIALAKTLEEKGFAYRTPDGLYYDTTKFPAYGKLGNRQGVELKGAARVPLTEGKHRANDFALWRKAKEGDLQQWDSPWGRGNPGWHIECSAMSRALLGQELDIHTGGEDHVSTHHNNEIAQSEAANGRTFVHYWLHNAFLNIFGEKIAKSLKNEVTLAEVVEKGFHPLAMRYFYLQAHYRTPLSFSWDALGGAAEALSRLWRLSAEIKQESGSKSKHSKAQDHFLIAVRDDLGTPQALGTLWDALRSEEYTPEEKWGLISEAEAHLGLSLLTPPTGTVSEADMPKEVQELLARREVARGAKDFAEADRLRSEIEKSGYHVDDTPEGAVLTKRL